MNHPVLKVTETQLSVCTEKRFLMSTSLDLAMMNNLATRSLSAVILTSLYFTVMLIGFLIDAKVFDSCLEPTFLLIGRSLANLSNFLRPIEKLFSVC